MSTKIRLTRMGKKKSPFYRIIVTDSRKARDGQYLDQIGTYDPMGSDETRLKIDSQKAKSWLSKGCEPTLVVKNLLTESKIFEEMPSSNIKKKNKRKNRLNPIKDRIKKEKLVPKSKTSTKEKTEKEEEDEKKTSKTSPPIPENQETQMPEAESSPKESTLENKKTDSKETKS